VNWRLLAFRASIGAAGLLTIASLYNGYFGALSIRHYVLAHMEGEIWAGQFIFQGLLAFLVAVSLLTSLAVSRSRTQRRVVAKVAVIAIFAAVAAFCMSAVIEGGTNYCDSPLMQGYDNCPS
jgi:hypothetical protein